MNGVLMQMLRFADDIEMLVDSEENLRRMILNFDETLKQEYNMKISMTKTKILVRSRPYIDTNIMINNITLERVNSITYIESVVTSEGESITVINYRIAQADIL